ncbi:MAG: GntR family transcriptional regulator [Actinomycetota bacterium]|nr:MAG: GntR family transcriptional regulator [Actinomycetota bacterium]
MANDTERVYQALRRRIIEGVEPPGARLIEHRLAETFACSRTPVREAVRRLESEGLVVVEPNCGAEVRPLSEVDISDLYEVRARLEAYAAELAAVRGEPQERHALRDACAAFDAAAGAVRRARRQPSIELVRDLEAANGRFHGLVLAMSRHARVQVLVAAAVDAPLVFRALQRFTPDELERSCLFHDAIATAICAGEPARAGRLMTEHVLQGRDALLAQLSAAGGVGELFAVGR